MFSTLVIHGGLRLRDVFHTYLSSGRPPTARRPITVGAIAKWDQREIETVLSTPTSTVPSKWDSRHSHTPMLLADIAKEIKRRSEDGAFADYDHAIAVDSRRMCTGLLRPRRSQTEAKGDLDGALADYDRAIELNPQDASASTTITVDRPRAPQGRFERRLGGFLNKTIQA